MTNMQCPKGYLPSDTSPSVRSQSGAWTPAPNSFTCIEMVALITGGFGISSTIVRGVEVEVFGPNGFNKTLSNLPGSRRRHSVDYLDGALYLCGGSGITAEEGCLKGEYQNNTKGRYIAICSIKPENLIKSVRGNSSFTACRLTFISFISNPTKP